MISVVVIPTWISGRSGVTETSPSASPSLASAFFSSSWSTPSPIGWLCLRGVCVIQLGEAFRERAVRHQVVSGLAAVAAIKHVGAPPAIRYTVEGQVLEVVRPGDDVGLLVGWGRYVPPPEEFC